MALDQAVRRISTLLLVLLLLWPVIRGTDGLPLSTYPMYAGTRSSTVMLITARGVDATAEPIALSMPQIAETLDPLIAQSFLNDAVASGSADQVCRDIATRVGSEVAHVEIAREERDSIAYARGDSSLISRQVLVTCDAGR